MNNPVEVELKLLIDPAAVAKFRRQPLLKALCPSGPRTRKLHSIYFDTGDFFLKSKGLALRVRRDGRQWIQAVKGGGSVQAGLHQRNEWEAPVSHNTPDFDKITDPALVRLFAAEELRQSLHPVFVTEFSRTAWLLTTADGDLVEMALDRGEIRADLGSAPISEVELELKSGNPAALYELALELLKSVPLSTENASKAERGYALCMPPAVVSAVSAGNPEITGAMSVDEAFHAIVWACLGQLQANQFALLQGYDSECIHQMRVAVRRLRCAISLFSATVPAIRNVALIDELRWLAGQIGPARDWDVFLGEMLPPLAEALPEDAGVAWLRQQADKIFQRKRRQARAAIAGPHYNEIVLRLGAWLWRAPWRTAEAAAELGRPVTDFAVRILSRRHRRLRRRGRHLAELTVVQRHVLRISAKKLRYATEFFLGIYPGKRAQRYLGVLEALQDELGALNDQAMAGRLLAQLDTGKDGSLHSRAVGVIIGWNACKTHLQLSGLDGVWKHFKQCRTFWRGK